MPRKPAVSATPAVRRAKPADAPAVSPADTEAVAKFCAGVCWDSKAEEILVYDARANSVLADFYVVCTGTSDPHLRALRQHLEESLKGKGVRLRHASGNPGSGWTILDFGDVLVHVFHADQRRYYNIEELWKEYPVIHRSPDVKND